jgi:hypothetical protein
MAKTVNRVIGGCSENLKKVAKTVNLVAKKIKFMPPVLCGICQAMQEVLAWALDIVAKEVRAQSRRLGRGSRGGGGRYGPNPCPAVVHACVC